MIHALKNIPISDEAEGLPKKQDSGHRRDPQQTASLSSDFAGSLEHYAAATIKAEQLDRLDAVLKDWAQTSNHKTGVEQASQQGYQLEYLVPGMTASMTQHLYAYPSGARG